MFLRRGVGAGVKGCALCRFGLLLTPNRTAVDVSPWGPSQAPTPKEFVLIQAPRRPLLSRLLAGALAAGIGGCAPLGMTLPVDPADTYPAPEGSRIKPAVGWLTTAAGETVGGAPEGAIAIQVVRAHGKVMLQQVRHYMVAEAEYGDSILLDRRTLRPIETYRWTPAGTSSH